MIKKPFLTEFQYVEGDDKTIAQQFRKWINSFKPHEYMIGRTRHATTIYPRIDHMALSQITNSCGKIVKTLLVQYHYEH